MMYYKYNIKLCREYCFLYYLLNDLFKINLYHSLPVCYWHGLDVVYAYMLNADCSSACMW